MGQAKVKREKLQAVFDAHDRWKKASAEGGVVMLPADLVIAIDGLKAFVANQPAALNPDQPADLNAFRCPHCDAERPPYGWHFNIGDTGPFALQWITCFCGECKGVLGVSVVQFMPKQELVDQLKR